MMHEALKLLIVDDDQDLLGALQRSFRDEFQVATAQTCDEAKERLSGGQDVMLLDLCLDPEDPSNRDGLNVLEWAAREFPHLPIIIMTAYGDLDLAVDTMRLGAVDFLDKVQVQKGRELRKRIRDAVEKARLRRENLLLKRKLEVYEPWEIIGEDPKIQEVERLVRMVARDGQVTVLIRGESGTGKELTARAIHSQGVRKQGPFVAVSLASRDKGTITSDLFGHEKGAFTGATGRRIGFFEEASGGILFLDEIGELEESVQLQLLRSIEEKTITRLGSNRKIPVDIQLVTATNKDLERAVAEGQFRRDLYFRLKVVEIHIPPLRERKGDIPALAEAFLERLRQEGRTKLERISSEAMEVLKCYDWPGNVRQLMHVIEGAIYRVDPDRDRATLLLTLLPPEVRSGASLFGDRTSPAYADFPEKGMDVFEELARAELTYIESALRSTGGKKTEAWKLLGYNDRFAMKRRLDAIRSKYPSLLYGFEWIRKGYEADAT